MSASHSPRALWTGVLQIGEVQVPVRMLTATDPDAGASFNQAHLCKPGTVTRIKQKKVCPGCKNKELAAKDIARVYEHAPGQYIQVSDEDLEKCEAESSTAIEIRVVVRDRGMHPLPLYVETTTFLAAADVDAVPAFETMSAALGSRLAFGVMVLRKRTVHVALQACAGGFFAYILRSQQKLRHLDDLILGTPHHVDREHVAAARQLFTSLEGEFHYEDLEDEYATRVARMLKRIAKKTPPTPEAPPAPSTAAAMAFGQQLAGSVRLGRTSTRRSR